MNKKFYFYYTLQPSRPSSLEKMYFFMCDLNFFSMYLSEHNLQFSILPIDLPFTINKMYKQQK